MHGPDRRRTNSASVWKVGLEGLFPVLPWNHAHPIDCMGGGEYQGLDALLVMNSK